MAWGAQPYSPPTPRTAGPQAGWLGRDSTSCGPTFSATCCRTPNRLTGGSSLAAVAQAAGATGRPFDRRIRVFKSETGAVQHLFQADGGALPPAFHNHYNEFGV